MERTASRTESGFLAHSAVYRSAGSRERRPDVNGAGQKREAPHSAANNRERSFRIEAIKESTYGAEMLRVTVAPEAAKDESRATKGLGGKLSRFVLLHPYTLTFGGIAAINLARIEWQNRAFAGIYAEPLPWRTSLLIVAAVFVLEGARPVLAAAKRWWVSIPAAGATQRSAADR